MQKSKKSFCKIKLKKTKKCNEEKILKKHINKQIYIYIKLEIKTLKKQNK